MKDDKKILEAEERRLEEVPHVDSLYENWFLDYASYVILDRAVPAFEDGMKPVQRRILHSFWEKHDGRYHKIANIIGHTMQYHPHGDASIGDALVNMGQKELLIDTQGNWGNVMTGDRAAAPRYIEGRLTPFAREVLFNPETTNWIPSYDGRANEPVALPAKYPLLLALGTEGIAVGLSTRILPHNFRELLEASVAILRKRSFELYPDFLSGGIADVSNYNEGRKGGRVKVRAVMEKVDAKTLVIREIPFGTTTTSVIDSVVSANDKGKIKIRRVEDNTAANVEILIQFPAGSDLNKMIDALYAFTDCEVSLAPNCCVIQDGRPVFVSVKDMLKDSTRHTVDLLEWELKNLERDLERKWHMASLERIFIENKVYMEIEKARDREEMILLVSRGLEPHIKKLRQDVTRDDVLKLVEIPVRRISRFDLEKNRDLLKEVDEHLELVRQNLENITDFAVTWFRNLLEKYGKNRQRRTRLEEFRTASAVHLAEANQKLFVNRKDGFIGLSLKKEEHVFDVSPFDEIIVFKKDCTMQVLKVSDKVFVGRDIVYVERFQRGNDRRVYNLVYQDGPDGKAYIKRFNVGGVTRERDYPLGGKNPKARLFYLSSNANGEAEVVDIFLKPRPRIKLNFTTDFAEVLVKGRASKGNILSKHPLKRVRKLQDGHSTFGDMVLYYEEMSNRVNMEKSGRALGGFSKDDRILVVRRNGSMQLFEPNDNVLVGSGALYVERLNRESIYTAVIYDGDSCATFVRRFLLADLSSLKDQKLVGEHEDSRLLLFTDVQNPRCLVEYRGVKGRSTGKELVGFDDYPVRSFKARGQRLTTKIIKKLALAGEEIENDKESLDEALKHEKPLELDLFS